MPEQILAVAPAGSLTGRERLIVALDVPDAESARRLVARIGDAAGFYKVGLQLFTAEGPRLVQELVGAGHKVFLDLKFHDIPATVGHAVKSAASLGVTMLTVHATGGSQMLQAAVEAADRRLLLLAVTVLTSFSDANLVETGVSRSSPAQVLSLASLARDNGCPGVVTSARETAFVRSELGPELIIVNPGIRPAGWGKDDQERIATPYEATRAGADYIVVGRPITSAAEPARVAGEIVLEIGQAQTSAG